MIGSAVLVLPWAFKEAGLFGGISKKYLLNYSNLANFKFDLFVHDLSCV